MPPRLSWRITGCHRTPLTYATFRSAFLPEYDSYRLTITSQYSGSSSIRYARRPVISAASSLMQAARARRLTVAYASANHRPDNATSGRTVREVDSELRAIEADQQPLYKPTQLGCTGEGMRASTRPSDNHESLDFERARDRAHIAGAVDH